MMICRFLKKEIIETWPSKEVETFYCLQNVLGVGLKQNPCRYWIKAVFVFISVDNVMSSILDGLCYCYFLYSI